MSDNDQLQLGTLAIHGGQSPDPSTGAVMPPIYATSTFVHSSPGVHQGLDYGRSHNPTRWALERCVADIESGYFDKLLLTRLLGVEGHRVDELTQLCRFDSALSRNVAHELAVEAVEKLLQVLAGRRRRHARGAARKRRWGRTGAPCAGGG